MILLLTTRKCTPRSKWQPSWSLYDCDLVCWTGSKSDHPTVLKVVPRFNNKIWLIPPRKCLQSRQPPPFCSPCHLWPMLREDSVLFHLWSVILASARNGFSRIKLLKIYVWRQFRTRNALFALGSHWKVLIYIYYLHNSALKYCPATNLLIIKVSVLPANEFGYPCWITSLQQVMKYSFNKLFILKNSKL